MHENKKEQSTEEQIQCDCFYVKFRKRQNILVYYFRLYTWTINAVKQTRK